MQISFVLGLFAKMECHIESLRKSLIDGHHLRAVHKGYARYEGWLPCFSLLLTGLAGEVSALCHSNPVIIQARTEDKGHPTFS